MNSVVKRAVPIVISALLSFSAFAQPPRHNAPSKPAPIPAELFLGTQGWAFQMVVDKKFKDSSRFGIFGLSYLKANYDNEAFLQESLNLALLKYDVYQGISILSGALYSSQWGFRPYAGAQYAYHNRVFMGMVNSGFHLTATGNFETIAMTEYRPTIQGAWSLYIRAQGMYSLNTSIGEHDRSYVYSRLGISYKTYSAGLAFNYDVYGFGAMQLKNHQWGVFISTLLF
jgi:hypothetical protein